MHNPLRAPIALIVLQLEYAIELLRNVEHDLRQLGISDIRIDRDPELPRAS